MSSAGGHQLSHPVAAISHINSENFQINNEAVVVLESRGPQKAHVEDENSGHYMNSRGGVLQCYKIDSAYSDLIAKVILPRRTMYVKGDAGDSKPCGENLCVALEIPRFFCLSTELLP